ncbi:TPA: IpaC/SipC family type III secretion system effector [Salmonella enterica subsp. enterica serovar Eastbourne]
MLTINSGINQADNILRSSVQSPGKPEERFVGMGNVLSENDLSGEKRKSLTSGPALSPPIISTSTLDVHKFSALLKSVEEKNTSLDIFEGGGFNKANENILHCIKGMQNEKDTFFDISNMSSNAIALLVAANVLMLSLGQADSQLAGKLSLVSFDAAKNIASSMRREGAEMLAGNILQSALQLGVTGVGAKVALKGLRNEKLALQQNSVKLNTLADTGKETSELSRQNIMENLAVKAHSKQVVGNAIMSNSIAVGTIAVSSGQYAATLERSSQQIQQASNRVAGTASEDSRENARKVNNLIQEMLKIMESISQSKMATMAAIAGNIRG